jgi:ABC-type phosphonate transport system ATPase subunit
MSTDVVARFERVTKPFGDQMAVEDVSFEVRAGRIVGLVGRIGSRVRQGEQLDQRIEPSYRSRV